MKNLEERIKIEEVKDALKELFSEYGNILEIVAKKNMKAKGQAFIVFDEIDAATRAIEEVQGFELFEKPMILDYAKNKSDATILREGDADKFETHKRKRLAEKGTEWSCLTRHKDTNHEQNEGRLVRLRRQRGKSGQWMQQVPKRPRGP